MARDNWKLGEMEVPFSPAPKGSSRVGVQFELDADGILRVLARDTATGRDSIMQIQSAIEVADEAVEKMLGDSLEHAFEDMDERIFTEARLKADEMLPAVERALAQLGSGVAPDTRNAVATLVTQIHTAIANRDTPMLKAHLAELDHLTEPLAAALVESLLAS
jgi:molecular chaperone DnaK